jgi:hypothetical protein
MVAANEKDWTKLPGFGKVLAKKIWGQLHGVYDTGDGIEL